MIEHPNNMFGMWRADAQQVNDASAKPVKKVEPTESEDEKPPLCEDDDDDDLDENEPGDEEPKTNHLVFAQFDKVRILSV
jgi:hypothetical protein